MANALANDDLYLVCAGKEMRVINGAGLPNAEFQDIVEAAAKSASIGVIDHGLLTGDTPYASSSEYDRNIQAYEQEHQRQPTSVPEASFSPSGRPDLQEAIRDLHARTRAVRVDFAKRYDWGDADREAKLAERLGFIAIDLGPGGA